MKRFYSIVLCVLFTAACGLNDKPDTASLGLSAAPSPSASVLACSYTDAYAQLDPDSSAESAFRILSWCFGT